MKRFIRFLLCCILAALGSGVLAAGSYQSAPSLKETFERYVKSVQSSDLKGLFQTVTDDEKLLFLTASGERIDTRKGYYKFHEEWFQEKDWEMPVELLEVHEGKDYGYATALFHYRSKTGDGRRYFLDSYFTLIFHKENGSWKVVADVCTPISRKYADAKSSVAYSADQMFLLETIRTRRTVRRFKPTPVPREHIMEILDAARFAPTAGNQQPWKFLVVQDRKKLDELKNEALRWYVEPYQQEQQVDAAKLQAIRESTRKALEGALSAPVYIAILVDTEAKYPEWIAYDGTLAAGSLMIAARALGYGTGFYTTFFPESRMKVFFRIPDRYKLICFTPVGVPEEWPQPPAKKPLADLVVFEKFQ